MATATKMKCLLRVLERQQHQATNDDLGTLIVPMSHDSVFADLMRALSSRMQNQHSNLVFSAAAKHPSMYIVMQQQIDSVLSNLNNPSLPKVTDWNDAIRDVYNTQTQIILVVFTRDTAPDTDKEHHRPPAFEELSMQQWSKHDVICWVRSLPALNATFKQHIVCGLNVLQLTGWDLYHCKTEYELAEALCVAVVVARKLFHLIQSHLNNPRYNFTPFSSRHFDPISFALVQALRNAYLVRVYNVPHYIIYWIYECVCDASSSHLSLWLDAADESTLTLDEDGNVLKWRSKCSRNLVLECVKQSEYRPPARHQRHAQNAQHWAMPKLLRQDDAKHPHIVGVQYSFQQTHCFPEIAVGTIVCVMKYKRINRSCTFFVFGHGRQTLGALHGSYDAGRDLPDKYILGKGSKNEFYLNTKQKQPDTVEHWQDEYKIATMNVLPSTHNQALKANHIGSERDCHAFEGVIAELIVYPRALQPFERTMIEQYLINKYKLIV